MAQSLYVIAAEDGPVKIGIARDPAARIANLQTGSHLPLRLAHTEAPPHDLPAEAIEAAAHALLRAAHVRGEWFNVTVEQAKAALAGAIEALRNPPPAPSPTRDPDEHLHARAWRKARGYSRPQLADLLGVHPNTIANMEAGTAPDRMPQYRLACAAIEAGLVFDWRTVRIVWGDVEIQRRAK